jgi:hypothetical protein
MQTFLGTFQVLLGIYCISSLVLLRSPLGALAYFLFFRATLSIAAYTQVPGFVGVPYFIPALAILLLQTMVALTSGKSRFRINRVFGTHIIFVGLSTLISAGFVISGAELTPNAEEISKYMFPLLAYVLVYVGIRQEADLDKVARYLTIGSLIPIFAGLAEFALNIGYSYDTFSFENGFRPAGTIIDPNLYGIYLALCLFLALPKILQLSKKASKESKKTSRNISGVLYLLVVLFSIVVAKNRGTWVALSIAFAFSVWFFRRHVNVSKWILSAILLIACAAPVMMARFGELNEYDQWGQKQDTASERLQYSIALLDKAAASPLFGNGANSYDIGNRGAGGHIVPPHDDYVRIAVQYGFPATLIYIAFFLSQLKWTIKHRKDRLWTYQFAACAGQVYLIVISVAQNVLTDTTVFMLVLSMMAISHRASALSAEGQVEAKKNLLIRQNPVLQTSSLQVNTGPIK